MPGAEQASWPYGSISVDLRAPGPNINPAVKAFVNVTIPLGADGAITLCGFSVLAANGQTLRVAPPARKGNARYFDLVSLAGRVRSAVERAVVDEYRRQEASAGERA